MSIDPNVASTPEPPPKQGYGDVWLDLIVREPNPTLRELYKKRREFGLAKYGTPLQYDNGRDNDTDLIQEILDAIVYAETGGRVVTGRKLKHILLSLI